MRIFFVFGILIAFISSPAGSLSQTATSQTNSAKELTGLWKAKRRFGPDVRGALIIRQFNGEWRAEIAGCVAAVKMSGDSVAFGLADGNGNFLGKFDARRTKITGHWIQAKTDAS